jgi:hypothetical protein
MVSAALPPSPPNTLLPTEYCDLGTLTSYASKTLTDPSDEEQLMQMLVLLQDAARGIAALHSKFVVHGDGACCLRPAFLQCACSCVHVCVPKGDISPQQQFCGAVGRCMITHPACFMCIYIDVWVMSMHWRLAGRA